MIKRLKGFTLIELLIVVAIIAILAAIAVPNFLEAQVRSKVSRVRADIRSLATGIESYYVDNNIYPAQASSNPQDGAYGANSTVTNASQNLRNMPTFRLRVLVQGSNPQRWDINTLTTPVSYITSYFSDPFADSKGATFSYSRDSFNRDGWIVWSYGPDTDERVTPTNTTHPVDNGPILDPSGGDIPVVLGAGGIPYPETTYYNPSFGHPSVRMTNISTYDPTNGITSGGDVYRVKQ
ncbi:MAG TPA: prepilin-type N-terminal cleavage/methylation domain-containing protein [Candidatus Sumerlaeota bacterium]|nr:prepilin-type N-terminal cleavage/methylation domain-containing protein [Candidatus Sumerlaeota bacterium]